MRDDALASRFAHALPRLDRVVEEDAVLDDPEEQDEEDQAHEGELHRSGAFAGPCTTPPKCVVLCPHVHAHLLIPVPSVTTD